MTVMMIMMRRMSLRGKEKRDQWRREVFFWPTRLCTVVRSKTCIAESGMYLPNTKGWAIQFSTFIGTIVVELKSKVTTTSKLYCIYTC